MSIPPPPHNATIFQFWTYVDYHFRLGTVPTYGNHAKLPVLMCLSFNCYDVPALKIAIAAFNPTSLIELLGADAYDASISDLVGLHLIYHFLLRHFWSDTGSDIPIPVPYSSWFEYRHQSYDIATQMFPKSSAWFVTSARRSSSRQSSGHVQTSARRKSSRRSLKHIQIKRSDNARSPPALALSLIHT